MRKTVKARAIWPIRYASNSRVWALSTIEEGMATLVVQVRPLRLTLLMFAIGAKDYGNIDWKKYLSEPNKTQTMLAWVFPFPSLSRWQLCRVRIISNRHILFFPHFPPHEFLAVSPVSYSSTFLSIIIKSQIFLGTMDIPDDLFDEQLIGDFVDFENKSWENNVDSKLSGDNVQGE